MITNQKFIINDESKLSSTIRKFKDLKIIVFITSCEKCRNTRLIDCKNTWVNHLKKYNIPYYFVIGKPRMKKEFMIQDDILYVKCFDTYNHLPDKTRLIIKWFNNNDYDYLLKCDDDSFLYVNNLYNYELNADYIGKELKTEKSNNEPFMAGCGYFLSKKAALYLGNNYNYSIGAEDLSIGKCLMENKDLVWFSENRIKNNSPKLNKKNLIDHWNYRKGNTDNIYFKYKILNKNI